MTRSKTQTGVGRPLSTKRPAAAAKEDVPTRKPKYRPESPEPTRRSKGASAAAAATLHHESDEDDTPPLIQRSRRQVTDSDDDEMDEELNHSDIDHDNQQKLAREILRDKLLLEAKEARKKKRTELALEEAKKVKRAVEAQSKEKMEKAAAIRRRRRLVQHGKVRLGQYVAAGTHKFRGFELRHSRSQKLFKLFASLTPDARELIMETAVHFVSGKIVLPVVQQAVRLVPNPPLKDGHSKAAHEAAHAKRVQEARERRLQARAIRFSAEQAIEAYSPALLQNLFKPARGVWVEELRRIEAIHKENRGPSEQFATDLSNARKVMEVLLEEVNDHAFEALSEAKQEKLRAKLVDTQTEFYKLQYQRSRRHLDASTAALDNALAHIESFPAEVETLKVKIGKAKASIPAREEELKEKHAACKPLYEAYKVAEKAYRADKTDEDEKKAVKAAEVALRVARNEEKEAERQLKMARGLLARLQLKLAVKHKSFGELERKRDRNVKNVEDYTAEVATCKKFAKENGFKLSRPNPPPEKAEKKLKQQEAEMDTSE